MCQIPAGIHMTDLTLSEECQPVHDCNHHLQLCGVVQMGMTRYSVVVVIFIQFCGHKTK